MGTSGGHDPWDEIDDIYAKNFVNNGAPAYPSRMAFGALLIKQMLKCSEPRSLRTTSPRTLICSSSSAAPSTTDNECPFAASTVTYFRKRFSEDDIKRINEQVARSGRDEDEAEEDGGDDDGGNSGTLIADATVAPSDIAFPQDMKLLNDAREHAEGLIDSFHAQTGGVKPRTYRKCARKDFLNWSKSKRRSAKATRKAIGRQLGYIRRDLGYIRCYLESGVDVCDKDAALIETLESVLARQAGMHEAVLTAYRIA